MIGRKIIIIKKMEKGRKENKMQRKRLPDAFRVTSHVSYISTYLCRYIRIIRNIHANLISLLLLQVFFSFFLLWITETSRGYFPM